VEPVLIEQKAPIRLVGLRAKFRSGLAPDNNAGEVIGPLWGQLHGRLAEIDRSDPTVLYGYSWHGDPAQKSHPDELEYVAGAPVSAGAAVPEGMEAVETADALYAVFEHRGSMTGFGDTLAAIYGTWLPDSGYVGNGLGDVEVYDERWNMEGPGSVMEYWVGIRTP
jgi:AraC family transcriptional regulator